MAEFAQWTPRSAWAGIAEPGHLGAEAGEGVTATLLDGWGLASFIPASGRAGSLSQVEQCLGVRLPAAPRIVFGAGRDVIGTGPGQWLLRTAKRRDLQALLTELAPHAAVTDQSDSRAALQLSGPHLRDALAKGVMIDLHPAVFAVGDAAATSVAHIGIQLWRLPDAAEGPVIEIMVARSLADSFWSWFTASAAEFGCRVEAGRG